MQAYYRRGFKKLSIFDYFSGVECEIAMPGKIEEFLSHNCRSHYEQLVKNGYFVDRTVLLNQ